MWYLCATDDGGRHWRRVPITALDPLNNHVVWSYVRWSRTVGIVSAGVCCGIAFHREFYTLNGGKTWTETSALSTGGITSSDFAHEVGPVIWWLRASSGERQLWYSYANAGGATYQVTGWPLGSLISKPVGPGAQLQVTVTLGDRKMLVMSEPQGIDCGTSSLSWHSARGSACSTWLPLGTTVTLTAVPDLPTVSWSGCSRVYPSPGGPSFPPLCEVALTTDTQVTAAVAGSTPQLTRSAPRASPHR